MKFRTFSLKRLLLAVGLIGVVLGLFVAPLLRARHQKSVVARLDEIGALVTYDDGLVYNEGYGASDSGDALAVKESYLNRWLGHDFLNTPTHVDDLLVESGDKKEFYSLLSHLKDIRSLHLGTSPTDFDLTEIARISPPKLESIALMNQDISDTGVSCLGSIETLKGIYIGYPRVQNKLSKSSTEKLATLNNLEILVIESAGLDDRALRELASLTSLRQLGLPANPVSDEGIRSVLAGSKNLEALDLREANVSGEQLEELGQLTSLKTLLLQGSPFTDLGLKELSKLKNIEYLEVSGPSITDEGIESISKLPKLRKLSLTSSPITDQGIKRLVDNPLLEELYLNACAQVSDASVSHFTRMSNLKALNLEGCNISDACLKRFREVPSLTELYLDQGVFRGNEIRALGESQ